MEAEKAEEEERIRKLRESGSKVGRSRRVACVYVCCCESMVSVVS